MISEKTLHETEIFKLIIMNIHVFI